MDEGAEALTCCGIPDTANEIISYDGLAGQDGYIWKGASVLNSTLGRKKRKLGVGEDI